MKKVFFLAILVVGLFCSVGSVHAAFSSDTLVNDDATTYDQSLRGGTPAVVISGSTVYATWLDARAGAGPGSTLGYDVYFAKGTMAADGKISFGTNVKVNDTSQTAYSGDTAIPSMAVASDGTIFIVWQDERDETGGSDSLGDSIYLARSTDGGISFLANQKIDILPSTETYLSRRSPRVAAAGGYVYVTFGKGTTEALEMSISSDNGASFGSVQEILPVPANETVIAADGNYVYVASLLTVSQGVGQTSTSKVVLYVSSDHGQTFGSEISMLDAGLSLQAQDLTMAASGGNLYLAWQDNRNVTSGVGGGYYIYGAVSQDNGASFGANTLLAPDLSNVVNTSDDNRHSPSLAAYGDTVVISCHGVLNGSQSVIANICSDKGETCTGETMVSDAYSRPDIGPSSIAIGSGAIAAVWQAEGEYVGDTGTGNNIYAAGYVLTPASVTCPADAAAFSSTTSVLTLQSICIDGTYFDQEIQLELDFNTGTFTLK